MAEPTWRVYRFEHPHGGILELASHTVTPDQVPVPDGYRFVSSTPLYTAAQLAVVRVEGWRAGHERATDQVTVTAAAATGVTADVLRTMARTLDATRDELADGYARETGAGND